MQRRGIEEAIVRQVLTAHGRRQTIRLGRDVLQSQFSIGEKRYLVRVIVDVDRTPAEVVTVYRTSKIEKYGRSEP